ncbi:cob(I)yrinic acid a,c-diamide adenosyltransferase [Paenibacillus brevis]|uniref:Corrinoid adenosyltransferase n=1 Tax=Paenibacillus brevis TaxID=2841508 RepID=A0ABS6FNY9_9BACL|nr:cob(I)yrinic acid a,c-diamide adenosyltransferase [Paenibacillus brevis]MBU5671932.1 cob(I)yrinic acid a,c-diamide adenosyltransferase [Paenibacillus brevis]
MKLYTRTGDAGQTSVIGGRVDKDDLRIEAYGTIDELNSYVGLAAAYGDSVLFGDLKDQLQQIQHELFDCGADLAYATENEERYKVRGELSARLEAWMDQYQQETPPIEKFILPGGTQLAAALHVCRTVCRRAERRVVSLFRTKQGNGEVLIYLNRLSDYFFAASRVANYRLDQEDVEYIRSANVFGKSGE